MHRRRSERYSFLVWSSILCGTVIHKSPEKCNSATRRNDSPNTGNKSTGKKNGKAWQHNEMKWHHNEKKWQCNEKKKQHERLLHSWVNVGYKRTFQNKKLTTKINIAKSAVFSIRYLPKINLSTMQSVSLYLSGKHANPLVPIELETQVWHGKCWNEMSSKKSFLSEF